MFLSGVVLMTALVESKSRSAAMTGREKVMAAYMKRSEGAHV